MADIGHKKAGKNSEVPGVGSDPVEIVVRIGLTEVESGQESLLDIGDVDISVCRPAGAACTARDRWRARFWAGAYWADAWRDGVSRHEHPWQEDRRVAGEIRIGARPVSHTFGIPGVHNTELYDQLSQSAKIKPVLVMHEACGAFAADAMSRTGAGRIGCLVIVPAAGLTHAMSGIGECYLDGIPLLAITGGTRTDIEFGYQLHELDQQRLADGIVKRAWKIAAHREIVPTIFEAYRMAVSGVPGPVLVEIPVNLQLFEGPVESVPSFTPDTPEPVNAAPELDQAARLLVEARSPGIFVGWGAVDVADSVAAIAEMLGAPVATTLQGLSAFPGNHPLHAGMGFSRAAVPAAENAFRDCDCLLAIGTSFGEIPTGSFGCRDRLTSSTWTSPPARSANLPVRVGIVGDSRLVVPADCGELHRSHGARLHSASRTSGASHRDRQSRLSPGMASPSDRSGESRNVPR